MEGVHILGEKVKQVLHVGTTDPAAPEQDIQSHQDLSNDKVVAGFVNGKLLAYLQKDEIMQLHSSGESTLLHKIEAPVGLINKEFDVAGLCFRQKRWADDIAILDEQGKELMNCHRAENGYTVMADTKPVALFNRGKLEWDNSLESTVPGMDQVHMFAVGCACNRLLNISLENKM